ncbi:hypothetical protein IF2G_01429 [Cordyceps javanica]|nr:hypothetical protein IF2G_01429 [Cordyceps javanica]
MPLFAWCCCETRCRRDKASARQDKRLAPTDMLEGGSWWPSQSDSRRRLCTLSADSSCSLSFLFKVLVTSGQARPASIIWHKRMLQHLHGPRRSFTQAALQNLLTQRYHHQEKKGKKISYNLVFCFVSTLILPPSRQRSDRVGVIRPFSLPLTTIRPGFVAPPPPSYSVLSIMVETLSTWLVLRSTEYRTYGRTPFSHFAARTIGTTPLSLLGLVTGRRTVFLGCNFLWPTRW